MQMYKFFKLKLQKIPWFHVSIQTRYKKSLMQFPMNWRKRKRRKLRGNGHGFLWFTVISLREEGSVLERFLVPKNCFSVKQRREERERERDKQDSRFSSVSLVWELRYLHCLQSERMDTCGTFIWPRSAYIHCVVTFNWLKHPQIFLFFRMCHYLHGFCNFISFFRPNRFHNFSLPKEYGTFWSQFIFWLKFFFSSRQQTVKLTWYAHIIL